MNGNNIKSRGRSSSQRSIYDYPEHLNPFYEDENHKRLRFWKIGNDKSSRSNSFSIDGLKNFWTFKTFKLKKRSSTLGINKTSESPPVEIRRRDDRQYDCESQLRHTVDMGLGGNFQRGAKNRSSLQDLSSNENFIRNNRYRSTVQASSFGLSQSNRYQSVQTVAPITPVFRSRYSQPSISKGTSQLSVNSNPFDDDYETISELGSPARTSIRHSGRKKRRAPQPPLPPNKTLNSGIKLDVEATEATKLQDSEDITNLTAEIESFVRIADTDDSEINKNETNENVDFPKRQSPEHNDCYPQDCHTEEITIERIENLGEISESTTSPIQILIRTPTDDESNQLSIDEELKIKNTIENNDESVQENMKPEEENLIIIHQMTKEPVEELKIQNHNVIIAPALAENVLKITESSDDLTALTDEIRHEVCKIQENKIVDKKVPPTPPLRRRSVKEIIESINKCQRLLKVNQDQQKSMSSSSSPSKAIFIDRNINDTNKKDYQNKRLFTDITEVNNNTNLEIPLFVEKFNELNNNSSNTLFEKCVVQSDEKESNHWNPVPKPRRQKWSKDNK